MSVEMVNDREDHIYIKFEDSSDFIRVNTMDSAWKYILEHGSDKLEYIEHWSGVDDLKLA